MNNYPRHTTNRLRRRLIATVLTVIYLVIALSPLASLAMHSKIVTHAITGECSGDCDICGCSLESRTNHTCCCAKKNQKQASDKPRMESSTSTPPKQSVAEQKNERHSKSARSAANWPVTPDCCAQTANKHEGLATKPEPITDTAGTETTIFKCGCPCGKGKLLTLTGFGSNELIPTHTSERLEPQSIETLFADFSHRLAFRHGVPPDPPPKISPFT